jgi:hypothetical protein
MGLEPTTFCMLPKELDYLLDLGANDSPHDQRH